MKLSKNTLFKPTSTRAETLLDKTTRLAREIIDDDAEKRRLKTAKLREARLEKEAEASTEAAEAAEAKAEKAPRKPRRKSAPKR